MMASMRHPNIVQVWLVLFSRPIEALSCVAWHAMHTAWTGTPLGCGLLTGAFYARLLHCSSSGFVPAHPRLSRVSTLQLQRHSLHRRARGAQLACLLVSRAAAFTCPPPPLLTCRVLQPWLAHARAAGGGQVAAKGGAADVAAPPAHGEAGRSNVGG